MVAPDSEMVFPPLVVRVPPQTGLLPLATVRLLGRTSVKPTPVSATVLIAGLVMVKPNAVVWLSPIKLGLNALAATVEICAHVPGGIVLDPSRRSGNVECVGA